MDQEIERLLFTEKPFDDESFVGYLLRLAELNLVEQLNWILQSSNLNINFRSIRYPGITSGKNLNLLSQLAEVSVEALYSMTYQINPEVPNRLNPRYLLFGKSLPYYFIFHRHSRVCSLCLREQNYLRRIWEFAPVTACLLHKCLLADSCPHCQSALFWNRRFVSKCRCGFDFRQAEPIYVSERELRVAIYVYKLCGLEGNDKFLNDKNQLASSLTELNYLSFFKLLLFFASNFANLDETSGKVLLTTFSNLELHNCLDSAAMIFDDFPQNFFVFLDWKKYQKNSNISHRSRSIKFDEIIKNRQQIIDNFQSSIRRDLDYPQYDFIHTALAEYINSPKVHLSSSLIHLDARLLGRIYLQILKRKYSAVKEDW